MTTFSRKWPAGLDAVPLNPPLPTLIPADHVLRHLRTLLFGATQNGEHLTTLVGRQSVAPGTVHQSPLATESHTSNAVSLVIDGFAHTLSPNTVPIPVYAQLTDEPPVVKYLPPGDTTLTAFPIAALCRMSGTDLEVTFSVRVQDIEFHSFEEQPLSTSDVKLSENSLSILLRTEPCDKHGLLEQRSTTSLSVQPVRLRDTTGITRVAGAWCAGDSSEYLSALAALGRHLARRRNRRIALSSPTASIPTVAKVLVLRFDNSAIWTRWLYILVKPTTTKWFSVCFGNAAPSIPLAFEPSQPLETSGTPARERRARDTHRRHKSRYHAGSGQGVKTRSRGDAADRRRTSGEGSTLADSTGAGTASAFATARRKSSKNSTLSSSDDMEKEEAFMTERMRELKYEDDGTETVGTNCQDAGTSAPVRIRDVAISDEDTTRLSGEGTTGFGSVSRSNGSSTLHGAYSEDEATLTDLCRKYLNVDYDEAVSKGLY